MSTEQKPTEPNALASGLGRTWTNFKQGKLVSYKVMAVVLLVAAAIGLWWYITAERKKAASKVWLEFDEANTVEKLEELAKKDPNAVAARLAKLSVARARLGPEGIDLLGSSRPDGYQRAVENIEKAREEFTQLLDQFKDDPVFKAECLLGLAKAEAVLVGVPTKPGQLTEFKGQVPKLIEYLDQLSAAAAPDTPWATASKKLADDLRKDPGSFTRVQRELVIPAPALPKFDPHGGGFGDPFGPGGPLPK